jgi:hypothetical protein
MKLISKELGYLIGLMCGRGHISEKDKKIIIEFPHKNKIAYGIAYCDKCGNLATSKKGDAGNDLTCKVCGKNVSKDVKKVYEQKESTITSINNVIIPFLKNKFNINFDIVGNDHMTLLILDFINEDSKFKEISYLFEGKTGFDSFEIPKELAKSDEESKIEFINGLMDTAGFFNAGSWLIREGEAGFGVMRGYFQIVRNWKMPVQICDFLYEQFSLTIQTIDWGHPNMRDQANIYAWGREHQVKFFPENYSVFEPRIKHKREMFEELVFHNKKIKFNKEEAFSISSINKGQIKPFHPAENDSRLPVELKGTHFDSSWQIALGLGCRLILNQFNKTKNKEAVYLTGKDEEIDLNKISKDYELIRKDKTEMVERLRKKVEEEIIKKENKRVRTNPEQKLYAPICKYLEETFSKIYKENVKFYDTSSFYLNRFILENNLYDEFEYYEEYKIKPDLVGFIVSSKKIILAEIKANQLSLKDLGQLRGYCLISHPESAWLISKEEPSLNLRKILNLNKQILSYESKDIEIGKWSNNKIKKIEI